MALVFASFTPHTPLILPQIGKEHRSVLRKTEAAFETLKNELYAAKPDTIMVISAHGDLLPSAFTLNLNPTFTVQFKDFGDLVTRQTYRSDIGLTHHFKEHLETTQPITMTSTEQVDHGIGVPLIRLLEPFKNSPPKIIPLMYSMLNFDAHYSFGMHLQQDILNSTKRIAVIGSGELSHRLTKKSPAGYSPKGEEFDQRIISLLEKNQLSDVTKIEPTLVDEAGECGFRSLLILLGILNSIACTPRILAYEAPFGIGYLTVNFELH